MGYPFKETHCFRGYPIFGSFKQFTDTSSKYLLHLDCDMIFYEAPDFSWIQEGMRIMEENEDILCVLPRGGPPNKDETLHQGTTEYQTDKKRELFLFKNFTSRHYLIHKQRFMSLLPLKPLWLSWREPIKCRFLGKGKMLCWESMVGEALENSNLWRADLMTDQAWSIHPGDRSAEFYKLLPKIIESVSRNDFPIIKVGTLTLDWVIGMPTLTNTVLIKNKYLLFLVLATFLLTSYAILEWKAPWVDECYTYYGINHDSFASFINSIASGINFSPPLYFFFNFLLHSIYPSSLELLRIRKHCLDNSWCSSLFLHCQKISG